MTVDEFFRPIWKDRKFAAYGLWPISLVYMAVVELRRLGYATGLLGVEHFSQPVVVFGNLTVGGTGKTPLTIWAVNYLKDAGFRPGVISRGYGRRNSENTRLVDATADAQDVGDEPLVIWQATSAPVAVAKRRADAIRLLMKECDCDVFLSDDGLQHLSLATDLKILLIDGRERFGNRFCLPAGPLREPVYRATDFDLTIVNGQGQPDEYSMQCELTEAINLLDNTKVLQLDSLAGKPVFAFAGIRHPEKFFGMLKACGIESRDHSFSDHHEFDQQDFDSVQGSDHVVLMTEKDAVKCMEFAQPNWWYVRLKAEPEKAFQEEFSRRLKQLTAH